MWWIFLLLTVVPALELYLLLQIGSYMGPVPTLLLILFTGFLGAALAKREGFGVLRDLQRDLQGGLPSAQRLMEGAMVLAGGLLLLTPGILTDITGFTLVFPLTRKLIAPRALAWLGARFQISTGQPAQAPPDPGRAHKPFANPFDDLP